MPRNPNQLPDDRGSLDLLAAIAAQARRDARRGCCAAEAWLAPLEASRPRSVRLVDQAVPQIRPGAAGQRRR